MNLTSRCSATKAVHHRSQTGPVNVQSLVKLGPENRATLGRYLQIGGVPPMPHALWILRSWRLTRGCWALGAMVSKAFFEMERAGTAGSNIKKNSNFPQLPPPFYAPFRGSKPKPGLVRNHFSGLIHTKGLFSFGKCCGTLFQVSVKLVHSRHNLIFERSFGEEGPGDVLLQEDWLEVPQTIDELEPDIVILLDSQSAHALA